MHTRHAFIWQQLTSVTNMPSHSLEPSTNTSEHQLGEVHAHLASFPTPQLAVKTYLSEDVHPTYTHHSTLVVLSLTIAVSTNEPNHKHKKRQYPVVLTPSTCWSCKLTNNQVSDKQRSCEIAIQLVISDIKSALKQTNTYPTDQSKYANIPLPHD